MDSAENVIVIGDQSDSCTYCNRKFIQKDGKLTNAFNRKRHLNWCAAKHKNEIQGQSKITSFFAQGTIKKSKRTKVNNGKEDNKGMEYGEIVEHGECELLSMDTVDKMI